MPKKKVLPPATAIGDGTPEGEAARQIKEIHSSAARLIFPPGYVRSPGFVAQGRGWIVKDGRNTNDGKLVFRELGKAGADLDRPPGSIEIIRAEQTYHSEINKALRIQALLLLNREKRGANAAAVANAIRGREISSKVIDEYLRSRLPERNRAPLISKKLGISCRTVDRILAKLKKWTPPEKA